MTSFSNSLKLAFGVVVAFSLFGCQAKIETKRDDGVSKTISAVIKDVSLSGGKNAVYAACTQLGYKVVSSADLIVCAQNKISENRERELMQWLGTQIQGLDNEYTMAPKAFISFGVKANGSGVDIVANAYTTILDLGDIPRKYNLSDETAVQQMQALLVAAGAR